MRLDVLQIGDDGEGHDDQQRPGTPFTDVNAGPRTNLIGIAPNAEKRTDVFSQPDEETDEHEGQQQGHAAFPMQRNESDGGPGVET